MRDSSGFELQVGDLVTTSGEPALLEIKSVKQNNRVVLTRLDPPYLGYLLSPRSTTFFMRDYEGVTVSQLEELHKAGDGS
jgi:hypothetical protein